HPPRHREEAERDALPVHGRAFRLVESATDRDGVAVDDRVLVQVHRAEHRHDGAVHAAGDTHRAEHRHDVARYAAARGDVDVAEHAHDPGAGLVDRDHAARGGVEIGGAAAVGLDHHA